MSKKAKHQTVPKELKRFVAKAEKMPIVSKVVLGETESCRHSYSPGSVKIMGDTRAGVKLKGYFGGGVISLFLVCEDRAAVKAAITGAPTKRKAPKKTKKTRKERSTYTVVRQNWIESEKGWGQRPDGYSLHLSNEDKEAFLKKFYDAQAAIDRAIERADHQGFYAPELYERHDGDAFLVDVPAAVYREVKASKKRYGERYY